MSQVPKELKIAFLLPVYYQGGTLRLAKNLAKMIQVGSKELGVELNAVFGNTDGRYDVVNELRDLTDVGIEIRNFSWKTFSAEEASGMSRLLPGPLKIHDSESRFCVPSDGAADFLDCHLWVFACDRIFDHLLPMRRSVIFATDFIQRYVPGIFDDKLYENPRSVIHTFMRNLRNVDHVVCSTPGTLEDARSYAGVTRVSHVAPIVDPDFLKTPALKERDASLPAEYILWVTNGTQHKNHAVTLHGLQGYYAAGGTLPCVVTGVNTHFFDIARDEGDQGQKDHPYHREIREVLKGADLVRRNLIIRGNVSDESYARALAGAKFLLHSVVADNGTYSVVEAALVGVPSLSSRYSQQEYLNEFFGLDMLFFETSSPADLAQQLHHMETRRSNWRPDMTLCQSRAWPNQARAFAAKFVELANAPRPNSPILD